MKAVQLVRWQQEPELREVAVPEPGAIEVLVKVEAAGLCHSDLHVIDWPEGTLAWELPFTLGHETAGTVAAAGDGVTAFDEGDAVLS
jgi:propanol-preferring alcohol dehydrogenase